MTTAAEVAKLIRKDLKAAFPGEKFSITSESFSMGNAVNVNCLSESTDTQEVRTLLDKYKDGDFNSMEDIHEYRSNPENLPRVKYVSVQKY